MFESEKFHDPWKILTLTSCIVCMGQNPIRKRDSARSIQENAEENYYFAQKNLIWPQKDFLDPLPCLITIFQSRQRANLAFWKLSPSF